jgi:hypothetical protein
MTTQDNNPNYEPAKRPEQSPVISAALMRQATIRKSIDKMSVAHQKMSIGHSHGVETRVRDWSEKHDPLRWMNVESIHTQQDIDLIKEVAPTDGKLKLQDIIELSDNNELDHELFVEAITSTDQDVASTDAFSGELDVENRLTEARALVARTFTEKPYQFLQSDPADLSGYSNSNFTLDA